MRMVAIGYRTASRPPQNEGPMGRRKGLKRQGPAGEKRFSGGSAVCDSDSASGARDGGHKAASHGS